MDVEMREQSKPMVLNATLLDEKQCEKEFMEGGEVFVKEWTFINDGDLDWPKFS